jgi:hypothetical protein
METLYLKYSFLTHITSSRSRRQLSTHYRYHKSPLVDPNPSLIKFTPSQSTSCIMYVNMHIVFQSTPILSISWRNHFWNLHSTKWRERDCHKDIYQNTRRHFPENNDVNHHSREFLISPAALQVCLLGWGTSCKPTQNNRYWVGDRKGRSRPFGVSLYFNHRRMSHGSTPSTSSRSYYFPLLYQLIHLPTPVI